ncbi:beta-N-acetylhexosaminidase [Neomicrococcus aestuarii]|uniref:beta-N-acetylhexosaminidase n=2 Tax=Neomicrococcus aestuarii TaxID=556325 RepID=A0A1L2ZRG7_9MICC|nr:glycoside hydrolase family 3 N-terminal domain-containing protein [Neomicrococcus aestuarii]APF41954.1 beta-N-acetylhexosaminidase [Neomicrococcus aestuarii]
MTMQEKAGQVLVAFFSGKDYSAQAAVIKKLHLGGVIMMGDNIPVASGGSNSNSGDSGGATGGAAGVDTAALKAATKKLSSALASERSWPGIVGVDQEGGQVARVQAPLTEWPTGMTYGAANDPALTEKASQALNQDLADLGFTMNFAPDADVTIGPADPVIGARSMGSDPSLVATNAEAAWKGAVAAGVIPSLKHFPGHGSVTSDSHVGLPVQSASVSALEARDWVPFKESISAGVPMIMMGHIAVTSLDPGVASSVSSASYKALRDLGFEGVVVTDALNMGALTESYSTGQETVAALKAGADLLIMPSDVSAAHAAIVAAVKNGSLKESRLDEAAARVVALQMMQQHKLEAASSGDDADSSSTDAESSDLDPATESQAISAAAITTFGSKCSGPLVSGGIRISGGNATDRARLASAAEEAGLSVGNGTSVALLGTGSAYATADVVVALDAPYGLANSQATTKVALYGRTEGAFDALIDVLTGDAEATGMLPVEVGDLPIGTSCGS